jgi:hypothetical protein
MHAVSLLVILIGLGLIAAEVLPRTGYAAIDPRHPPQTWCAAEQTPPAPTALLEQRVHFASEVAGSRWRESSTELAKQLLPQRAVLARLERPELLSQPSP